MTKNIPNADYIQALAEIIKKNDLTEIEINNDEIHIRLGKDVFVAPAAMTQPMAAPSVAPVAAAPIAESSSAPAASTTQTADHPGVVASPMVGIVYTKADPDSPDFISVGSQVSEGDTLFLLEAMKIFNPVKAPRSGTVKEIFVQAGEPVEFGSPLVIIE